jgi:hypothetical protein
VDPGVGEDADTGVGAGCGGWAATVFNFFVSVLGLLRVLAEIWE